MQVLFSIIIGSFHLGQALPELETIFTALGAATVVYEVIDKVSTIHAVQLAISLVHVT